MQRCSWKENTFIILQKLEGSNYYKVAEKAMFHQPHIV